MSERAIINIPNMPKTFLDQRAMLGLSEERTRTSEQFHKFVMWILRKQKIRVIESSFRTKTDERLQEKRKQPEINNKLMWDIYGARFIVKNKEDKEKAHFVLESFFSAFYQRYFILPLENDGIDNPWQSEQLPNYYDFSEILLDRPNYSLPKYKAIHFRAPFLFRNRGCIGEIQLFTKREFKKAKATRQKFEEKQQRNVSKKA